MNKARKGMFIGVHYTGRLEDGREFDSTRGRSPVWFRAGNDEVLPAFEESITSMAPGDEREFSLPAPRAFGPRDLFKVVTVSRDSLPVGIDPSPGEQIGLPLPGGERVPASVLGKDRDNIILDFNHPLAGHTVVFEVQVVGIEKRLPCQAGPHDFKRTILRFKRGSRRRTRRREPEGMIQGWPSEATASS